VQKQNEEYEKRGNSALVYDSTYARHWDTWTGPKHSALFSVDCKMKEGKWVLSEDWASIMGSTKRSVPVEPFGGLGDFDADSDGIVYTTKATELPAAWHTRQDVFHADLWASSEHSELTTGTQGATRNPVCQPDSGRVAWLELDKDGYEVDRAQIVIYDRNRGTRMEVATDWDRSPNSMAVWAVLLHIEILIDLICSSP